MKLLVFAIFVTLSASLLVGASPTEGNEKCDGDHHHHSAPAKHNPGTTRQGTRSPQSEVIHEDDDEEPGPAIPTGRPRGPIKPSSPHINLTIIDGSNINRDNVFSLTRRQNCGGGGILFDTDTVFANNSGSASEPSGARAGNIIFSTANWLAAISLDGGATFNEINPTVYSGPANPATDKGFCCDQIVQYLPSIDRFAWLIQYQALASGANKLRVITFHPHDLDSNGINSWLYLDILSTDLSLTNQFDAGELAVGDNYLWLAATNTGTGLVVIRIPIASLNVVGSLTYSYTDVNNGQTAYLSRLSQNPGDTLFWAGHSALGTTMRVFKWPESGGTYFWSDIRINDWPSNSANMVSTCPGGSSTNWIFSAAFATVLGSTRRAANEVWFAWAAPSGGGFPQVHIQIAQINTANWPTLQLIKQWQIWNANFAFMYPAFYTNACGDVGLTAMFGGGSLNPTGALGIANSDGILAQTVYYPELGSACENRFGDYLTVRSDDGFNFEGFVYADQSGAAGAIQRDARFVEFHRG